MSYLIPQVSKDKESDVQGFVAAIKRIKDAHEMTELETLRAENESLKQQVVASGNMELDGLTGEYHHDVITAYEQGKRDAVPEGMANFACYLIDHCENETIGEEFIQSALYKALQLPQYAAAPKQEK